LTFQLCEHVHGAKRGQNVESRVQNYEKTAGTAKKILHFLATKVKNGKNKE
jgi:hypothetical protein